jgi:hypothetical protein
LFSSCCLRLQATLVGSNVQNTSVSSGSQAKQMHGRQEVAKAPFLSRTNILRMPTQLNPDSSQVENTGSEGEVKAGHSCSTCIFLQRKASLYLSERSSYTHCYRNPAKCAYPAAKRQLLQDIRGSPLFALTCCKKDSFFQVRRATYPVITLGK